MDTLRFPGRAADGQHVGKARQGGAGRNARGDGFGLNREWPGRNGWRMRAPGRRILGAAAREGPGGRAGGHCRRRSGTWTATGKRDGRSRRPRLPTAAMGAVGTRRRPRSTGRRPRGGAAGARGGGQEAMPGRASRPPRAPRYPSPIKIISGRGALPASMIIRGALSRSPCRGRDQRFRCRSRRVEGGTSGRLGGTGRRDTVGESAGQSDAGRRRCGEARRDPAS